MASTSCHSCGNRLPAGVGFCPGCGAEARVAPTNNGQQPEPGKWSKSDIVSMIVMIGTLVGGLLVGYAFYFGHGAVRGLGLIAIVVMVIGASWSRRRR